MPEEKVDAVVAGPLGKSGAHAFQEVDEAGEVESRENDLAAQVLTVFHNDFDIESLRCEGGEAGEVAGDEAESAAFEEAFGPINVIIVEGEADEKVGRVEDVEGLAVDLLVGAKNGEGEVEGFGGRI